MINRTPTRSLALLLAGSALCSTTPAFADEASLEAEIARLKGEIAAQDAQLAAQAARLEQIEARLAAAPAVAPAAQPAAAQPPAAASASVPQSGAALAAAPVGGEDTNPAGALADTTIGGYGELIYNGYLRDSARNQADLRRLVLSVGHRFNDRLSFTSEVEIEHAIASADDHGEVAVEQAYLDYALDPALNLKAGLFLMPFGFINRSHEPPVFRGAERNEVETRIIPSTWREGGIGLYGTAPFGLTYDFGVTTGFDVAKFDEPEAPLAGSHQEMQLARAADLSFYGALEYQGIPGLLVGGSVFTGNAVQHNADFRSDSSRPDFAGITARVTLWDVHGRWQGKGFDIQALYARGTISKADALGRVLADYNTANGTDLPVPPSAFYGWYVQAAYSIPLGREARIDPFVRYEKFDTQARMPLGLAGDPANRDRVVTTGISFFPHDSVVFKLDYQKFIENKDNDRINLGLGYMF